MTVVLGFLVARGAAPDARRGGEEVPITRETASGPASVYASTKKRGDPTLSALSPRTLHRTCSAIIPAPWLRRNPSAGAEAPPRWTDLADTRVNVITLYRHASLRWMQLPRHPLRRAPRPHRRGCARARDQMERYADAILALATHDSGRWIKARTRIGVR